MAIHEWFDKVVEFDPAGDLEGFLKQAPALWVVYLMADSEGRPVQLLCVKNLRYSLKRRLGGDQIVGTSRRVRYRDLVRKVYWRRVDSALEADWVYLEAARTLFPKTYQGMLGFRPAWFVHVDPQAEFPRYTKTTELKERAGVLLGPVEDKHAAARLIELAEDCFDLCRYYSVLAQAPEGKACAYKEMGKCPAPCDGSIAMQRYKVMVRQSAETMVEPTSFLAELKRRMQDAAAGLQFELAGKIKAKIEEASQFGQGAFRHVRKLEGFQFLSLQRGPKAGTAKVFLVTPGKIELIAGLIGEPKQGEQWWGKPRPTKSADAELVGVVTHHLFSPKQGQGAFLPLSEVNETAVAKAYRELRKQKEPQETAEEEGVTKELQAM
jgi:excinuclease UvrABC nuclease subunit